MACLLVLWIGRWGMMREMDAIRRSVGRSQMSQAKSHAVRTVQRIELEMANAVEADLATAAKATWLVEHWRFSRDQDPQRNYRAIVDSSGVVVAHSESRKIGQMLKPNAEIVQVSEFGDDFIETQDSVLADGQRVIDIQVQIQRVDRVVGTYHVGVSADWLDKKIHDEQTVAKSVWTVVIASAMAIVGLTGTVLYRFARHATLLKRELSIADGRRLRELSTLMVGMAHEIRNPLNSIRLNLYTSERVFCGDTKLADQEVLSMLSESVREIERVDSIIGQLLGYARAENDFGEEVDVANEIQAAIKFVSPIFENQAVTIEFDNKAPSVTITMDRRRLRQILLNLLNNAREALADGGRIKVTLETHGKLARLTVADSGVGVDASIRSRMFEPFVSTRDTGTGLGLAVVRSMLESIEGVIDYETSEELGGAEFVLSFPISRSLR